MKALVVGSERKIQIFTKFYSVTDISKFLNISESLVKLKIKELLISPDLSISNNFKYSYDKMICICSMYNFVDPNIKYEIFESKINNETSTNTIAKNT